MRGLNFSHVSDCYRSMRSYNLRSGTNLTAFRRNLKGSPKRPLDRTGLNGLA